MKRIQQLPEVKPRVMLEDFAVRPPNLEILPGVRQLDDGRFYVLGRYPSGKTVMLPHERTEAPAARMIPAVEHKIPLKLKGPITTGVDKKRPVVHLPKRLHVVEVRWRAGEEVYKNEFSPSSMNEPMLELLWNALWISSDCGRTWQILGPVPCEYHIQYHIDEEVS